jgi:hypothetical protein
MFSGKGSLLSAQSAPIRLIRSATQWRVQRGVFRDAGEEGKEAGSEGSNISLRVLADKQAAKKINVRSTNL